MALETAQAGTLESSDCLVTVGPAEGRILDVRGGNAKLFAERTRRVVDEVLKRYGLRDVRVQILPREEAFQIPDLIRTKINLLPESITEVRIVEIEGLDLQADGGTHVRNTREVGGIRVIGTRSKGRINKRLEIELVDDQDGVGER